MPSTVIRRFDYDASARALLVEFVSGRRYRYLAVPAEEAEAMRGAFSKGRFFNARIRDRYACEEVEPASPSSAE
jgi:lysyl-tRNA synthetase class 2